VPAGAPALLAKREGKPYDKAACNDFLAFAKRYGGMAQTALLLPVPPASGTTWLPIGEALLGMVATGGIPETVSTYAAAGDSWRRGDAPGFASAVHGLTGLLSRKAPDASRHAAFEEFFNRIEPFYQAMGLYVLGFLILCAFWLRGDGVLRGSALTVIVAALLLHTFGLAARMWLQGRPPVTNLYSSAVFIGWGTALFGLFLERLQRDGIGAACSAIIGFVTLVIAQHLAGRGDTLEMLQAVLDTNIWLATHVVAITIGYSAMFLAGLLAVIYVVRGLFTSSLTPETARSLTRMIYGVICFATLFSFVGTVLGGIWADQSWGRFWGSGSQGERGPAHRHLVRDHPPCPPRRLHPPARPGRHGALRQRGHRLFMVWREHAGRRPPLLRFHGQGGPVVGRVRRPSDRTHHPDADVAEDEPGSGSPVGENRLRWPCRRNSPRPGRAFPGKHRAFHALGEAIDPFQDPHGSRKPLRTSAPGQFAETGRHHAGLLAWEAFHRIGHDSGGGGADRAGTPGEFRVGHGAVLDPEGDADLVAAEGVVTLGGVCWRLHRPEVPGPFGVVEQQLLVQFVLHRGGQPATKRSVMATGRAPVSSFRFPGPTPMIR